MACTRTKEAYHPRHGTHDHPLCRFLALLSPRARQAGDAAAALCRDRADDRVPWHRAGIWRLVVAARAARRLWLRLGRAFRRGEEPAGDLHLSAVVARLRLPHVLPVADRAARAASQ